MKLNWQIDTNVSPSLLSLMQTAADCALLCEKVDLHCSVHVRLCSDEAIRQINRQFRGIDKATDVLSFPLVNYPKGKTAGNAERSLRKAYDDDDQACCLGDIVIAVPHIYAQAEEYGHSPEREAAYLLIHGICHLMGYDHIEEDERRRMRAMEEKILQAVGMNREQDESCASDDVLIELAKTAMERSYAPYSHFAVGAALLCDNGRIYQGCNIENASYGLTNCAERTALFKAVSEGETRFTAIAIAAQRTAPWPCGACRQVLNEFAPKLRVIVTWDGKVAEAPLNQLLPYGFGPQDLLEKVDHYE